MSSVLDARRGWQAKPVRAPIPPGFRPLALTGADLIHRPALGGEIASKARHCRAGRAVHHRLAGPGHRGRRPSILSAPAPETESPRVG